MTRDEAAASGLRLGGRPRGLRDAEALLRTFHDRAPARLWEAPWRGPGEMWAVGTATRLLYSSDKQDPGDPADPGGTWRGYYHDGEPTTLVHVAPSWAGRLLRGRPPLEVVRPRWPEVMTWLGSADGCTVRVGGRDRELRPGGARGMRGMQLWGFPCPRHAGRFDLAAAPAEGGREADCILWCGPDLTIGRPGIDG